MANEALFERVRRKYKKYVDDRIKDSEAEPWQVIGGSINGMLMVQPSTTGVGGAREKVHEVPEMAFSRPQAGDRVRIKKGRSQPGFYIAGYSYDGTNEKPYPQKLYTDYVVARDDTDLRLQSTDAGVVTLSALGSKAPPDAEYWVASADGDLSAEQVVPASAPVLASDADSYPIEGVKADILSHINVEDGADVTDATNVDAAGAVMETDFNAKGDLLSASADDTPAILSVGTDGQILYADSGEASGLLWDDPPSGATLTARNQSGDTASAGDVGLLDYDATYGFIYETTTTEADFGSWCVVSTGGAAGADIEVIRRGTEITINYAGGAPSTGDILVTSTTAGSAAVWGTSQLMHPNGFAIATANGSGGTVEATLITGTRKVVNTATANLLYINGHSGTQLTMTQDGAPAGNVISYDGATGNRDSIIPDASDEIAALIVHNITQGVGVLIRDATVGGVAGEGTITTNGGVSGWANNDELSVTSLTNTDTTAGQYFFDVYVPDFDNVPPLVRSITVYWRGRDSGTGAQVDMFHPFETGASSKRFVCYPDATANEWGFEELEVPLIDRTFTYLSDAGGSGTKQTQIRLTGYFEAVP